MVKSLLKEGLKMSFGAVILVGFLTMILLASNYINYGTFLF